jgi:glycosyltransferase involved in cell wall biosynthesis
MKVCLLNYSDGGGGAHIAAYRLHQGLRQLHVDSTVLVSEKTLDDITVLAKKNRLAKVWGKVAPILDRMPVSLYPIPNNLTYSAQWLPDRISPRIARINPDIINLHWVNSGYLQIETLAKFNKPIVWTLHDMWAFTGGCHYSGQCERYTNSCGACPQLESERDWDLSRWIWKRKSKSWKNLNLTILTPSQWLADCARQSSLFHGLRIEVIPNSLDTQCYKPIEPKLARDLLNLPQDKQFILFGSVHAISDARKGFQFLLPSLQKLSQTEGKEQIEILIFGASEPKDPIDFGFKVHYLGKQNDDISLSLLYSAADVFVAPSLEDNLPNTIMEALACGTPCVTFNIGGMPDMIEHRRNGYLAKPFDTEDLAQGISWVLSDQGRYQELAKYSRNKVEKEFTQEIQANRYLSLFEGLIKPKIDENIYRSSNL